MKPYPQMPPFTQAELEAFLNESPIARLCTQNPDGTIHMTAGYFKYANGIILMGTQNMTRKVRNIKHNPQVSVLIDTQSPPWKGVLIYGKAEIDYEDAVAKRASIFERYGRTPEQAFQFASLLANTYAPAVIRITPDRLISYDYSKDGFINHLAPAE